MYDQDIWVGDLDDTPGSMGSKARSVWLEDKS